MFNLIQFRLIRALIFVEWIMWIKEVIYCEINEYFNEYDKINEYDWVNEWMRDELMNWWFSGWVDTPAGSFWGRSRSHPGLGRGGGRGVICRGGGGGKGSKL